MGMFPNRHTICVPVSFETGFQTTHKVPFGSRVRIHSVRVEVTKALADTNAGTVAIKNDDASVTHDTLSLAASAALGVQDTSSFADPVYVEAGDDLQLVSAKTNAGGEAYCFITYQNMPPR